MSIDRLLIVCSLVELGFIACTEGVDCYTCFQWTAIVLLGLKFILLMIDRLLAKRTTAEIAPEIEVAPTEGDDSSSA
jgi:hypothetical protein